MKNLKLYNLIINIYLYLWSILIFFLSFFAKKQKNKKYQRINLVTVKKNNGLNIMLKYFSNNDIIKKKLGNIFYLSKINKYYYERSVNIFIGNPDILIPAFIKIFKFSFFKNYNIGFWFWELEKIPNKWKLSKNMINEIWVNSDYIYKSIFKLSKNIKKVPFYINIDKKKILSKNFLRLPLKKFIFIFTFDFLSYYQRKNPEAVVNAFLLAFKNNDSVHLLLKSINGKNKPKEKIKLLKLIKKHKNIELRDFYCSYNYNISLISKADCYISLHRSEGLGMGMAEAMFLKKPVIATNYSGNLEFMNNKNSCLVDYNLVPVPKNQYIYSSNQYWADPNLKHAAKLMIKIKENKKFRQKISNNAENSIRNKHSLKLFNQFMKNELLKITKN